MNSFITATFIVFGVLIAVSQAISERERNRLIECFKTKGVDVKKFLEYEYFNERQEDIASCMARVPSMRPLLALKQLVNDVQTEDGTLDLCGEQIELNSTVEEGSDANFQKALLDTETEFCDLTLNTVVPLICKFNTSCDKQDLQTIFAMYYTIQQIRRNKSSQFRCPIEEDNKLLENIINQDLYFSVFDFDSKSILTKPLPCDRKPLFSACGNVFSEIKSIANLAKKMR